MSPCILWIDEVEKAVGGVKSSHQSDSGTLARVFGTLLTWMQEKEVEVPVIATANDFSLLPPEFIRRFSETFFMDLPTENERDEIWRIHISKAREEHPGRDPNKYDLDTLVKKTLYYTGAEIEKCVKGALTTAFAAGAADVENKHFLQAIGETQPLYKVMGEKVQELRNTARGRFIYASSEAAEAAGVGNQAVQTKDGTTMSLSDIDEDLDGIKLKGKKNKVKKEQLN
jgi:SpoVK/Ycf46/Vps4 family AAA+-type ATPase